MLVMGLAPILAPLLGGVCRHPAGGLAPPFLHSWRVFAGSCLIAIRLVLKLLRQSRERRHHEEMTVRKALKDATGHILHLLSDEAFMRYTLCSSLGVHRDVCLHRRLAACPDAGARHRAPALRLGIRQQCDRPDRRLATERPFAAALTTCSFYCCTVAYSALLAAGIFGATSGRTGLDRLATAAPPAIDGPLRLHQPAWAFISPNASAAALAHQGHRAGTASALDGGTAIPARHGSGCQR
jgi:DHA1 family bicyclomycin/chloramphenicol resistance-like MFS transporter